MGTFGYLVILLAILIILYWVADTIGVEEPASSDSFDEILFEELKEFQNNAQKCNSEYNILFNKINNTLTSEMYDHIGGMIEKTRECEQQLNIYLLFLQDKKEELQPLYDELTGDYYTSVSIVNGQIVWFTEARIDLKKNQLIY